MNSTTLHIALWPKSDQVHQGAPNDARVRTLRNSVFTKCQNYLEISDEWDPRADVVVYVGAELFENDESRWNNLPPETNIVIITENPGPKALEDDRVFLAGSIIEAVDLIAGNLMDEIREWAKRAEKIPA